MALWICLSFQTSGWKFVLQPEVSDVSTKTYWASVLWAFSSYNNGSDNFQTLQMLGLKSQFPSVILLVFIHLCFLILLDLYLVFVINLKDFKPLFLKILHLPYSSFSWDFNYMYVKPSDIIPQFSDAGFFFNNSFISCVSLGNFY